MTLLNPNTLQPETEEERKKRQSDTDVLGAGHLVVCRPNPNDPRVLQVQHRAVCMTKPYSFCSFCRHSNFSLVFLAKSQEENYELIACPRWRDVSSRLKGDAPERYVPVEHALCRTRPFDFCTSCPSKDEVFDLGADKTMPGWYGRWRRILKDLAEQEERERG